MELNWERGDAKRRLLVLVALGGALVALGGALGSLGGALVALGAHLPVVGSQRCREGSDGDEGGVRLGGALCSGPGGGECVLRGDEEREQGCLPKESDGEAAAPSEGVDEANGAEHSKKVSQVEPEEHFVRQPRRRGEE